MVAILPLLSVLNHPFEQYSIKVLSKFENFYSWNSFEIVALIN